MSIFKDKIYESMDWLSQAIEPIQNHLNDFLIKIPDEFIVPNDVLLWSFKDNSTSYLINKNDILVKLFKEELNITIRTMPWHEREMIAKCFSLKLTSESLTINKDGVIGEVRLVKNKNILDEEESKSIMQQNSHLNVRYRNCKQEAIIQLGTLFFEETNQFQEFEESSFKVKTAMIMRYVHDSVTNDYFKIRSVKAHSEFVSMIGDFLMEGSDVLLGKIYRVIMMAKNGQVIYNIEASK